MAQQVTLEAAPGQLTAHRRSLGALTGIRFFAAFYVVLFHTRVGSSFLERGHRAIGNFFINGYLAVPLFFLLSGFILAYTYAGQIETTSDRRRFWEARFARIWPLYMLSMLLTSLFFSFPPMGKMLAAIFMVQAWNPLDPALAGVWNFVCWTLSVEAFFYLVFPWMQDWMERLDARGLAILLAAMLLVSVAINSATRTLGYTPIGVYRFLPLPLVHVPEFFIGMGLGNHFLRRLSQSSRLAADPLVPEPLVPGRGLWTYGFAILSIALLCRPTWAGTSLVVASFAGLIYGLSAERTLLSRFLSSPALLLGGGISYAMYLVQIPAKVAVQFFADRVHLTSVGLRMVITLGLLLAISLILFKGVEDPVRRMLRGLFARIEKRRQAAQPIA